MDLRIVGGVRAGWWRASWPLATLSVSASQLTISATLIGPYSFTPDQVVAFEPFGLIPIFGRGIRIVHTRTDYPAKVIFSCFWTPDRLRESILGAGFVPRAPRPVDGHA
ncbi:MAG: hypothetical protein ABUT39_04855 [Acidobacteriota bacterium]